MDDRISNLEMLVAEQDKTIEEMSDVIARQWVEIETLQRKLEMFEKRFSALEEQSVPETPITKPPHY